MFSRTKRFFLIVGVWAAVGAIETVAHACGPQAPTPSGPACTTLSMHAPGAQFPLGLASSAIRVSLWRVEGGTMSALDDGFPSPGQLQLLRATASGFEAVPFALESGTRLLGNARTLRPLDPQSGRYYLAWDGDTCNTHVSPASTGKDVGSFSLTPAVPVPATLGTVAATPLAMRARDFQEGVSGDCSPVMVHVDEAEVVLTLTPSADVVPWADAMTTGLEVDGKVMIGFSKPDPVALAAGRLSLRVARVCASDTPRYLDTPGIAEGSHVGKVLAKIEGLSDVAAAEIAFEIHCDAPAAAPAGSASSDGGGGDRGAPASSPNAQGCNASAATSGGADGTTSALAMAALVAIFVRRSRARVRSQLT